MNNMRLKKLSIVAVMSIMCLAVNAQEKSCSKDFTPKKGDFTIAATVATIATQASRLYRAR